MSKNILQMLLAFIFLWSCQSNENAEVQPCKFEILATVNQKQLPEEKIEALKELGLWIDSHMMTPIIAYAKEEEQLEHLAKINSNDFYFIATAYKIKDEFAIVACSIQPIVKSTDISKAKVYKEDVFINYTYEGAVKLAKVTKEQKGNFIAMSIDDKIYALPKVHEEIRGGRTIINGIGDEALAKSIAQSINAGL